MAKESSITLRIEDDLLEETRALAKSKDRSMAYIIRDAVKTYIENVEASSKVKEKTE